MSKVIAPALLGLGLLGAPGPAGATPSEPTPPQALAEAGCVLCHAVPTWPDAPRTEGCASCHAWIQATDADPAQRDRARQVFPHWDRYAEHVTTYLEVPSLPAALARVEPAWLDAYLADPHDLRPHLPETMPRMALSDATRAAITDYARALQPRAVPPQPAPDPARAARGARLFTERGCAGCHTFGARHTTAAVPLAPDLAHARHRMDPDVAVAWIRDPASVSPHATMPQLGLTDDEALALRDHLWLADPGTTEASATPRPDDLDVPEQVTWSDVDDRVFGRICAHCHMDPDRNGGRGGPGHDGGFGYAAAGLSLQSRDAVAARIDAILAAMVRRHAEAARDVVGPGEHPAAGPRPPQPGMPLGLPPIPWEDIALVERWVALGMPE